MLIRYRKKEEIVDEMVDNDSFDCWVDSEKMGVYVTFGNTGRVRLAKKSKNYKALTDGMNKLYAAAETGFVDLTAKL